MSPMGAPPIFYFATSIAVAATVFAVVIAAFLVNRFAPRKRRHMRRTVTLALLYLGAFGVWAGLSFLHQGNAASMAREVTELLGAIALVSLLALTIFDLGLPSLGIDLAPIVTDLAVGLGYIVAALLTLHRAGFEFSGILATSALLTTITAFSLQSTLSNVVGGVALQLDSSVKVGDWVELESGRQGRVREIRWRYTVIETRDWDTLIVPNATLLSSTIVILGKREGEPLQHRMWVYFNVDFRYSPVDVIHAVDEALQAAPIEGIAREPKPHCICCDFAMQHRDSFAHYAVRYWLTDLARDVPITSQVRERIYVALKRAQIPLAMPAAKIWVEQDDAEHHERKRQREVNRRLKALAAVEILKPLRQDELLAIAERLRYAPFAPGEPITRQGAVAHWLYIMMTGTAEVRVSFDGSEKVLAKIHAPGFFGEMGLMTGEPRTATVVALTEVECYRLDKEAFIRIIKDRPEIASEISALLANRKVALEALREDMDAEAKARCIDAEKNRLLGTIERFFGLEDESV
jgi:small-conductance mechanosensitive channel/CRP-like cAMP-binding protein